MPFNPYYASGIAGSAVASLLYRIVTCAAEEPSTKPWYQTIRDVISKRDYRYSSSEHSDVETPRMLAENKISGNCKTLTEKHPETFIGQFFDDDEMHMPGVAIVAAYLRQKKGVGNLFVCKSHEAFQKKLEEVSHFKGDIRLALIMADGPEGYDFHDKKDGEYGSDNTHKLSICIEKTGSQIKIAILDPMVSKRDLVSPALVQGPIKPLKYIRLNGLGYVVWEIFHSSLDVNNVSIYYSAVKRQRNFYGCETFALCDGVAFLNDPNFFEKIQVKKLIVKEDDLQLKLNKIVALPPAFMVGTQSLKQLNDYYENGTQQDPKAMEELKKKVEKHLVDDDGTFQNHYNQQKSTKYHLLTLAALELLSTAQLQQIIQEPLLTVSRLPLTEGQAPKALSDLHYYEPIVVIEQD